MGKKLIQRFRNLDTVEKKSFWAIAPAVAAIGLVSIVETVPYFNTQMVVIAASACSLFAIVMMIVVAKTHDYHKWYPVFCGVTGGILIPVTFLLNGGFYSGMPLSCLSATAICACCYEKRSRIITFLCSFAGTMTAFFVSRNGFDTVFKVSPEWVADDMIFSYAVLSIGLFLVLNMLLSETRSYVINTEVLSGYVDSNVRKQLVEEAGKGKLSSKGVRKKVTVLFVDVSRFTSTTERMEPEMAAEYLNTFLVIADEAIHANSGILDKYIGDCAMAYWIDNDNSYHGILEAVKTVSDIRSRLYEAAEDMYQKFGTEMNVSAGLEYGDVVLGNIGSASRKDYTIIGDTVNTASRLQGIASPGELIVSENVKSKVGEYLELSPDEHEYTLKGKNKPVKVYSVYGLSDSTPEVSALQVTMKAKLPFRREAKQGLSIRNDDIFRLYICGCRGSLPVSGLRFSEFGGATSCYIFRKNDYAIVVDTGTGLLESARVLEGCTKIDILFTHVHYDHILGLLNLAVFPKEAKLRMFGHFGSWAGEGTIRNFLDSPYWPVPLPDMPMTDVILSREYRISEDVVATFYRTFHPDNGCVIKLMIGNQKVCVYSDLEDPSYMDPDIARCSDVLLYDGMFDRRDPEIHKGWGHSTWQDGVDYAQAENVRMLLITHHDPKAGDHELRARERLAKEISTKVAFARAGDVFIL